MDESKPVPPPIPSTPGLLSRGVLASHSRAFPFPTGASCHHTAALATRIPPGRRLRPGGKPPGLAAASEAERRLPGALSPTDIFLAARPWSWGGARKTPLTCAGRREAPLAGPGAGVTQDAAPGRPPSSRGAHGPQAAPREAFLLGASLTGPPGGCDTEGEAGVTSSPRAPPSRPCEPQAAAGCRVMLGCVACPPFGRKEDVGASVAPLTPARTSAPSPGSAHLGLTHAPGFPLLPFFTPLHGSRRCLVLSETLSGPGLRVQVSATTCLRCAGATVRTKGPACDSFPLAPVYPGRAQSSQTLLSRLRRAWAPRPPSQRSLQGSSSETSWIGPPAQACGPCFSDLPFSYWVFSSFWAFPCCCTWFLPSLCQSEGPQAQI